MTRRIATIAACVILSCATGAFSAEGEKVVGVVVSRPLDPYRDAVLGFKDELRSKGAVVRYEEFDLAAAAGKEPDLAGRIMAISPDLLYAVGTEASSFASAFMPNVPAVFSMVLNPVESGIVTSLAGAREANITGVSLNISVEDQFDLILKILPSARRIGMLYGAAERDWLRDRAALAAERKGLKLVSVPVRSELEVLGAVERICGEVDFLWADADPLIYNARSAQHILLITLRRRRPFMAFSSHYVEAGALAALECDYRDNGRQAGGLAMRILEGASAGALPVEFPRKTRLFMNARTAGLIGLDLPKELTDRAERVYGSR